MKELPIKTLITNLFSRTLPQTIKMYFPFFLLYTFQWKMSRWNVCTHSHKNSNLSVWHLDFKMIHRILLWQTILSSSIDQTAYHATWESYRHSNVAIKKPESNFIIPWFQFTHPRTGYIFPMAISHRCSFKHIAIIFLGDFIGFLW